LRRALRFGPREASIQVIPSRDFALKIDDPKMYSQPWMALNKFVLHRLPDNFDVEEFFCSPSETAAYNKVIGKPVTAPPTK
jgi:hypothetical protein